jgi:hypothetical protein
MENRRAPEFTTAHPNHYMLAIVGLPVKEKMEPFPFLGHAKTICNTERLCRI